MLAIKMTIEMLSWPEFGRGGWRAFRRNWALVAHRWFAYGLVLLAEPLMIWMTFGLGLGHWVSDVRGQLYMDYLLPAMGAICATLFPFWEMSQRMINRRSSQASWWVILQTPLTARDVAAGEILYTSIKGTLSALLLLVAGSMMGHVKSPMIWWSPLMLFPASLLFSSAAMWITLRVRRQNDFLLTQIFGVVPMLFWSETFFPVGEVSERLEALFYISPLVHVVRPLRALSLGGSPSETFLSLALICLTAAVAYNLAVRKFTQDLVPG